MSAQNVAFDAVGIKHDGGATVLLALVEAALASERLARITVFCSPRSLRNFGLPTSAKLEAVEVPSAERGLLSRAIWHAHGLPRAVKHSGASALLCLGNGGIPPAGIQAATLIQQSLPFASEALRRLSVRGRLRARALRWGMRLSCARSNLVIVQTRTMQQWVSSAFRIDPLRIAVVEPSPSLPPCPVEPSPELTPVRAMAPGRCLLYVGNDSPYKNLALLPQAVGLLREKHAGAIVFLTLARDHLLCSAPGVVGLGRLNSGALHEAYTLATALVLPSLVETVGLPMLEAASVGTPVLAADRPYAHDVCGGAALYFDPLDARDLAAKAGRMFSDAQLRADLGARGKALASMRVAARPYERMVNLLADLAERG